MNISSDQLNPRTRPRWALVAVTASLVLILLWLSNQTRLDSRGSAMADNSDPEACVSSMVAAEMAGNLEAYRNCLAGPLRENFDSQIVVETPQRLARRLRDNVAELTGMATTDLQLSQNDSAKLILVRVFPRRNDRFRVQLRRIADAWKIVSLTSLEPVAPEIPYGTPVAGQQ